MSVESSGQQCVVVGWGLGVYPVQLLWRIGNCLIWGTLPWRELRFASILCSDILWKMKNKLITFALLKTILWDLLIKLFSSSLLEGNLGQIQSLKHVFSQVINNSPGLGHLLFSDSVAICVCVCVCCFLKICLGVCVVGTVGWLF